ncbi:hypothetical protein QR680_009189 [Steinernema hermaphroditum]|uniref:Uncharacterized protein n=1 Tax=Steinernema hermaphroditum TaxID=289476 RepID=A0AA39M8Z3_9BILA|nr:hypothetical protein QR680_009189 [Steinernema hermaphroditum]
MEVLGIECSASQWRVFLARGEEPPAWTLFTSKCEDDASSTPFGGHSSPTRMDSVPPVFFYAVLARLPPDEVEGAVTLESVWRRYGREKATTQNRLAPGTSSPKVRRRLEEDAFELRWQIPGTQKRSKWAPGKGAPLLSS